MPWIGLLSLWVMVSGCVSWDPDFDGDGELPRVFGGNDCDNHDAAIPGVEVCGDNIDNDCNGDIDEPEAVDASFWFIDRDLDGFGDREAEAVPACTAPQGFVADHSDCDDLVIDVHPGVDDLCDGVDQDCDGNKDEDAEQLLWYVDADGDGYGAPGTPVIACRAPDGYADNDDDCDDDSALSNPGAAEICDFEDNDCDGDIDDGQPQTPWHPDADGDSYGDPDGDKTVLSCKAPDGFTSDASDCDDTDEDVSPSAVEIWYDGEDRDCDGWSDYDADLDGFASATETAKDGLPVGDDCDDTEADTNPDADEVWYDGVDQDCDGHSDYDQDFDGDTAERYGGTDCDDTDIDVYVGATEIWYDGTDQDCDDWSDYDQDADGYDAKGYGSGDDCLDTDAKAYPGATELWYNGIDNNCDGSSITDDYDADSDGYTSDAYTVGDHTDCDDTTAKTSPGADEAWYNGVDNDCDGSSVEEDYDADLDGYVDSTEAAKDGVVATALEDGDCDDDNATANPGETETWRNGVDNDCSGETPEEDYDEDADGHTWEGIPKALVALYPADDCDDEDATAYTGHAEVWYNGDDNDCLSARVEEDYDQDGDLHLSTKDTPTGVASLYKVDDCDDTQATVYTGATEKVADGVDQDCDTVDSCYEDKDGDGQGSKVEIDGKSLACGATGESKVSTDCDDTDKDDYLGATETPGNLDDEDCDGKETCYADADGDAYGTTTTTSPNDMDCSDSGESRYSTDCDDLSKSDYPGASEDVANGDDEDCDGFDSCYVDSDKDGYGTTTVKVGKDLSCDTVDGESKLSTDCDDVSAADNPGATEIAVNNDDDDCNGFEACYVDADGDKQGKNDSSTKASADLTCSVAGVSTVATDCNDGDASIYLSATETTADGIDQNCDTVDNCYQDLDGDAYGTASVIKGKDLTCAKSGESKVSTDCDDVDPGDYPGAPETVANGDDEDCDTGDTCYADVDTDGYGDKLLSTVKSADLDCVDIGEATTTSDCNDGDKTINPGASEKVADGIDQNCNGGDACYVDFDKDGYGNDAGSYKDGTDLSCDAALQEADDATDCDDSSPTDYPGATEEVANGDDEDCDKGDTCYVDLDGDSYGDESGATVKSADLDCADSGEANDTEDCDDGSAADNPVAVEIVGNSDDDNCDDKELCYIDGDGDGYGSSSTTTSAPDTLCTTAAGEADDKDDCDDAHSTARPGLTESWYDGLDNDCDGNGVGEEDYDKDGDGYVDTTEAYADGYRTLGVGYDWGDCNEADATINPGKWDYADGVYDDDCDIDGRADQMNLAEYDGSSTTQPNRWVDKLSAASADPMAVVGGADLDVSGKNDLAVGIWLDDTASTDAGAVYIGYANTDLFSKGVVLTGASSGDNAGRAVAMPGDLNADGRGSDLVVGIPGWGTTNTGAVCLVTKSSTLSSGSLTTTGSTARCSFLWVGSAASEALGASITPLGNFTADGVPDFAVGAPSASPSSKSGAGRVYILSGGVSSGTATLPTSAYATLNGATAGDAFGTALTYVDLDADGNKELVVGAPGYDGTSATNAGAVYLFEAGATAPSTATYTLTGTSATEAFGSAVAGGDLNGDGVLDLVVGAPGYDGTLTTNAGRALVYIATSTSVDVTVADYSLTGTGSGDAVGTAADFVGELDDDIYDDLIVGAPGAPYAAGSGSLPLYGAAHLVFGDGTYASATSSTALGATKLYYPTGAHGAGALVRGVGDMNADGYDDFVVGTSTQNLFFWLGR